ncbi:unnamed protein product [Thlaspi arvense]|uniref:Uncharacterized protein n=1 Tax=Thlaspi arvense TaxID=13288 RepID=A0AAU9SJG6_THLAR|nr:unnamed protein product [Thlaspi arvense]
MPKSKWKKGKGSKSRSKEAKPEVVASVGGDDFGGSIVDADDFDELADEDSIGLVEEGMVYATVSLAAGLVGTAISNGLIMLRKKMDPAFKKPNKPPLTVLNSLTWTTHMGVSANVRLRIAILDS